MGNLIIQKHTHTEYRRFNYTEKEREIGDLIIQKHTHIEKVGERGKETERWEN